MLQELFGTLRGPVRPLSPRVCCGFAEGLLKDVRRAWPGGAVAAATRQAGQWSWLEHRFDQQWPPAARGGDDQQPQAAGPRTLPVTPGDAATAVPKNRAVWRRASSSASPRLITKVPGWPAVQRCAVAGLAK